MKKLLAICFCLLLIFALAAPVFAAQSAKMTVTASKTDLKPGDKVTFTVSVSKVENCTVGGFLFNYDESVFSYESGKSLAGLKGFFAGVSTAAGNVAGFFMNGVGTVEGELFSVTLKVQDGAKSGSYTVTGRPSLTASEEVACTAVAAQVTVSGGTSGDTPPQQTPTTGNDGAASGDISLEERPPVSAGDEPTAGQNTPDSTATPDGNAQVDATVPGQENQHVDGDPQKPAFPWWIVAVIAAVAIAGAVFLILEFKKTKKAQ